MGKLIHICLGMTMTSVAFAQSAANFNTSNLAPTSPPPKSEPAAKSKGKNEGASTSITPSRFVGPAELDAYVNSLASSLSMRSRATDPFGQTQDPNVKQAPKNPVAKSSQRAPQLQATPFADIVRLLVVNTILPGQKRFLVGTRSFAQGEQIPLTYRGRQIKVQVVEVTSEHILFRNVETGETTALKMALLPPGVTHGIHGSTPPGMVADRPNAPIELEPSDPNVENLQHR
ncbi:MAG: hypothetical protein ABI162_09975 [Luteolibacter sp.]